MLHWCYRLGAVVTRRCVGPGQWIIASAMDVGFGGTFKGVHGSYDGRGSGGGGGQGWYMVGRRGKRREWWG